MRTAVLVALLCVAMLSGCTDGGNPPDCEAWHCRDVTATDPPWRPTTIPARTALEMDFSLRQGDELEWDWFVTEQKKIGFQLHYHEPNGLDKRVFDKTLTDEAGAYIAEASNTYSLMWINDSEEPLETWVQVEGEICYPKAGGSSQCAVFIEI